MLFSFSIVVRRSRNYGGAPGSFSGYPAGFPVAAVQGDSAPSRPVAQRDGRAYAEPSRRRGDGSAGARTAAEDRSRELRPFLHCSGRAEGALSCAAVCGRRARSGTGAQGVESGRVPCVAAAALRDRGAVQQLVPGCVDHVSGRSLESLRSEGPLPIVSAAACFRVSTPAGSDAGGDPPCEPLSCNRFRSRRPRLGRRTAGVPADARG